VPGGKRPWSIEPEDDSQPLGLDDGLVPGLDGGFAAANLVAASCNCVSSSASLVSELERPSARPHDEQYRLSSGIED
jgi:hypothetical protein